MRHIPETPCYNCESRKLQDRMADLHLSISNYLRTKTGVDAEEAREVLVESIADVRLGIEILEEALDCGVVVETRMFEKRGCDA